MYTIQDLKKKSYMVWFLLASQIGEFFLPHPVVCNIDCLGCQEQSPLTLKKSMGMLLTLLSASLAFPLGGLLLCLRVITVKPALVTSDNPDTKVALLETI
jgi:hypothetical protein